MLLRRAKQQVKYELDWQLYDFDWAVTYQYLGQRYDKDYSTYPEQSVKLGGVSLWDLAVSYPVTSHLTVRGRIANLFDKDYETAYGYATRKRILPHWKLYLLTAPPHLARRCWFSILASAGCRYIRIRQLLPDLHYIYAFDNVAFPYGEKSEGFIVERVLEIVGAVQQRHPLAIVVIACNTASTVSLPALRERFSFPVVGVVPAIKPAARLTVNGIVGLLATRGTVQRSYTHELISVSLPTARLNCWALQSWWSWRRPSCTAKPYRCRY